MWPIKKTHYYGWIHSCSICYDSNTGSRISGRLQVEARILPETELKCLKFKS